MNERGSEGGRRPKGVAGRRTIGPAPRPGRGYSMVVGLLFLAVIVVASVHMISNRDEGILGLQQVSSGRPLAEFAVPVATSSLEGDANIAQDDCESNQLPCPADQRRTVPAQPERLRERPIRVGELSRHAVAHDRDPTLG